MSDPEPLFDALAAHLDALDDGRRPLFLAKAALALGHALGDNEAALRIIRECAKDLERS